MAAVLPPIPRLVFTILEPISLIAGGVAPFVAPSFFVSSQLAAEPLHPLLPTEHVMALQMGNLYLLACLIGIAVLYSTTEAHVVHAYLWALWVADIGHVGVTAWAMGWQELTNVRGYNSMAWGNIGATTVLFLTRSAYFAGLLGQDRVANRSSSTKKKR